MASTSRTGPNSARPWRAYTARPATAPRRSSPAPWRRTCGSWLQHPCVPVALAMPFVHPEHDHAQAERHRAVIDLGANARLVAAVGGHQGFVQNRQAAHFGELLQRGVDVAQGLLLAAVVVAQYVARTHGVVLQMIALRQLGDLRV